MSLLRKGKIVLANISSEPGKCLTWHDILHKGAQNWLHPADVIIKSRNKHSWSSRYMTKSGNSCKKVIEITKMSDKI